MTKRLVPSFALLLISVAASTSTLHAGTVTFTYSGNPVNTTTVSGFGSFSYNGSLSTIGLGDLTSFNFEMDLSTPGAITNPAIFQYSLVPDLLSFSATVVGGVVTSLSLATDYESAINTGVYDETQKSLVVTSLATGGASNYTYSSVLNRVTLFDTGTITTLGPGGATPEPSSMLLAGGAALLLGFGRRKMLTRRG